MARASAASVLLASVAISACGGPGEDGSHGSSTTTSSPTTSFPTTSFPTTSSLTAEAEAVCSAVYAGRGTAPEADSGDIDDDMALFETWHANLLQEAISQLGSPAELKDLLAAMGEARRLSVRAALIYAKHPVFSEELSAIQKRQTALADEVGSIAAAAGAPSCGELVVLP